VLTFLCMTDYECPTCGGGFPATDAADDECPWCGEAMDGSTPTSGLLTGGIGVDTTAPDPPDPVAERPVMPPEPSIDDTGPSLGGGELR